MTMVNRPPIWNLKCDFCDTHTLCVPKYTEQKFYCENCGTYLGQAVHELIDDERDRQERREYENDTMRDDEKSEVQEDD